MINQLSVEFGEVAHTEMETALLNIVGNIVPALHHALAHAITSEVERGNPEPDAVARGAQRSRGADAA